MDDILKTIGRQALSNRQINGSEVFTMAFVSARYFRGHHDNVIAFLELCAFVTHIPSKSRFNRCLHSLSGLSVRMFRQFSRALESVALVSDCRQGCIRRYVKVLTNAEGFPVKFGVIPKIEPDMNALKTLSPSVAPESNTYDRSAQQCSSQRHTHAVTSKCSLMKTLLSIMADALNKTV